MDIKTPISAEPFTGMKRVAQHESFVIFPDKEMVQQIRVIKLDANDVPIYETIRNDNTLDSQKKQQLLNQYQDTIINRSTKDSYVDSTGTVLSPVTDATTGKVTQPADIPGAISQKLFLQSLTIGALKAQGLTIDDTTQVLDLIYTMLLKQILEIDARGAL